MKKSSKNEINPDVAKSRLKVVYPVAISFCILLAIIIQGIIPTSRDILNLTSIVVEITIGLLITWTVFLYSKKWDNENKDTSDKIKIMLDSVKNQQEEITSVIREIKEIEGRQQKIIEEQTKISKRWREYSVSRIVSELEFADEYLRKIKRIKKDLDEGGYASEEERKWLRKIDDYSSYLDESFKEMMNIVKIAYQNLDPDDMNKINHVAKQGIAFCEADFGYPNSIPDGSELIKQVDELIEKLS